MDFSDFQNLTIDGRSFQKLVRVSDGAVLFEKTPKPRPYYELEYDVNQGAVAIATFRVGYYAPPFTIEWGDGAQQTITPSTGQIWVENVRHDYSGGGNRTIKLPSTVEFVNFQNKGTIRTLKDYGDNFDFRLINSGTAAYSWNFFNLNTIDISRRTSVPQVQTTGFLDGCTSLNAIYVPKDLYGDFVSDQKWGRYAAKIFQK